MTERCQEPVIHFQTETYTATLREWLDVEGKHYLQNASPGCLWAVSARRQEVGLCGERVGVGPLLGLCLCGRPVARGLPQDGSTVEITRMVLVPGLPHGTASAMLRHAVEVARLRGASKVIAYHDRTRHTGCIYRKAGFRKAGTVKPRATGWGSRDGRKSAEYEATPKRRWELVLYPPNPGVMASRGCTQPR